jgi:hypothetical protein
MSTLVKNQHYVWQRHLKPWTVDGKLFCYRQSEGKIFGAGTKSIASETFFYKLHKLTEEDLRYLELAISKNGVPEMRDTHRGTIRMFQMPFLIRERMADASLPLDIRKRLNAELDRAEKTSANIGMLQSKIKQLG